MQAGGISPAGDLARVLLVGTETDPFKRRADRRAWVLLPETRCVAVTERMESWEGWGRVSEHVVPAAERRSRGARELSLPPEGAVFAEDIQGCAPHRSAHHELPVGSVIPGPSSRGLSAGGVINFCGHLSLFSDKWKNAR